MRHHLLGLEEDNIIQIQSPCEQLEAPSEFSLQKLPQAASYSVQADKA